jgi:flavin reductase (DIM6/NTAB) family NADH-FMN oxidoreductase RutF
MRKAIDLTLASRLINHGPVVLVSSYLENRPDITTIAWHMPISKDPAMVALEISDTHFIYECIMEAKDFVINVPSKEMCDIVIKCGRSSGKDIDKFEEFNLEKESSKTVKSPRLKNALAVLECELNSDTRFAEDYNIIIGNVKYAEVEEEAFSDHWLLQKEKFKTLHHLGDLTFSVPESKIIDKRKK